VSERLLQRLASGGRTGVFLAALAFILVALFVPGWIGALVIMTTVAALAVLMRHTWTVQPTKTRAVRVTVLAALVALAFYKATH
jgi:hypothetical protein